MLLVRASAWSTGGTGAALACSTTAPFSASSFDGGKGGAAIWVSSPSAPSIFWQSAFISAQTLVSAPMSAFATGAAGVAGGALFMATRLLMVSPHFRARAAICCSTVGVDAASPVGAAVVSVTEGATTGAGAPTWPMPAIISATARSSAAVSGCMGSSR